VRPLFPQVAIETLKLAEALTPILTDMVRAPVFEWGLGVCGETLTPCAPPPPPFPPPPPHCLLAS